MERVLGRRKEALVNRGGENSGRVALEQEEEEEGEEKEGSDDPAICLSGQLEECRPNLHCGLAPTHHLSDA